MSTLLGSLRARKNTCSEVSGGARFTAESHGSATQTGRQSQTISTNFLRSLDRYSVLQAARNKGKLSWEDNKVRVFLDYSRVTQLKCDNFKDCKKWLHKQECVHRIGTQVEQISSQPTPPPPSVQANLPAAAAPSPGPPFFQPKEPQIPSPEHYAGDLCTCRPFLTQRSLVFNQQPYSYYTDAAKIAFVVGLLKGSALDWATAVRERQPNLGVSFATFVSEMRKVFDHPVQGSNAAKLLLSLRQGTRSCRVFSGI